jgi:hypothetical protein
MSPLLKKFCQGCRSIRPASEFVKPTHTTIEAPDLCFACRRRNAGDKILGKPIQTLQSILDRFKGYQTEIEQVKANAATAADNFDKMIRELESYQAAAIETARRVVQKHEVRIGATGLLMRGGLILKAGGKIIIKTDTGQRASEDDSDYRKSVKRLYLKVRNDKRGIKEGLKQP